MVLVSNVSNTVILYYPSFEVVRLQKTTWTTDLVNYAGVGVGSVHAILLPGEAEKSFSITDAIKITPKTVAVRAGLSVTSLSWRGLLARKMSNRWLDPLASWLYASDRMKRTMTVWSEICFLDSTNDEHITP